MNPQEAKQKLADLESNIELVIRGKNEIVRMAIIGLLAHGHILFEDIPGVGKTTLAQCLSQSLGLSFQRIQFTSDLLPSDILGVTVYDPEEREFEFRKGPIFANVVLVDEINRTTPKTQSALLEAMNAATVSVDRHTHDLPNPFLVIATQNPIESHGTFPLPQSQLDRFMMRLNLGYPEASFEREILKNNHGTHRLDVIKPILSADDIIAMQNAVETVRLDESLDDYIVRLAEASRQHPDIEVGISTRGAIALRKCSQGRAYLEGRDYCTPDDIKSMVVPALAHRITLAHTYQNGTSSVGLGSDVVRSLLDTVAVPV